MINRLAYACTLSALVALAGCAKTTDMPSGGSESHFLMACEETSECGAELECHDNVCTAECESDAVCEALSADASCLALSGERYCGVEVREDASVPDGDGGGPDDFFHESEPLDEPVQMAFIAGTDDAEQIWLRGEYGALSQLSVWPVDPAREASCEDAWSTGGYPSGRGRFASLTFDPSGRFLLFSESLECGDGARVRVFVHELATGYSRGGLDLASQPVILADKHALVVVDQTEDDPRLYELDPGGPGLEPVDIPLGNTLTSGVPQLVSLGDESILFVPNIPVLRRTDSGFEVDPVVNTLLPTYWFSPTGGDPLGTLVCAVLNHRETSERLALLMSADDTWISTMSGAEDRGGPCAVSADGEHMMFDTNAYERLDEGPMDMLLDWPFAGYTVQGAFGNAFYATTPQGEIARLDLGSTTSQTVVQLADVEQLCGDFPQETAVTELIMPYDERPLAIVKRHCGCTDCDISGSLAMRLDDNSHQVVEFRTGEHDAYGVVWPVAGGARVLSSQSQPGDDPSTAEYIGVSVRGEVGAAPGLDGAPLLHGPAVPRRRPTANAAPLQCDLFDISWLLLSGQAFEDCGSISLDEDEDLDAALQCAGDAYDAGSAFRVLWRMQGDDGVSESGLVGREAPTGYEVFDLQYDPFGSIGFGSAIFTACVNHSTQPCEDGSGECPTCDAAGTQCRCKTHNESSNGVELTCDAP